MILIISIIKIMIEEYNDGEQIMYLCNCHGVTYRKVESLLEDGCEQVNQIQKECNAGKDCGSCMNQLCELVNKAKQLTKEPQK